MEMLARTLILGFALRLLLPALLLIALRVTTRPRVGDGIGGELYE